MLILDMSVYSAHYTDPGYKYSLCIRQPEDIHNAPTYTCALISITCFLFSIGKGLASSCLGSCSKDIKKLGNTVSMRL